MSDKRNRGLSIGAVARATGIPVETLRTWERRYGFPRPDRSDGGHRVYQPGVVTHLRLVSRALAAGRRASHVVGQPVEQLEAIVTELEGLDDLEQIEDPGPQEQPSRREERPERVDVAHRHIEADKRLVDSWVAAARAMDADTLHTGLREAWDARGPIAFLEECAGPFVRELGRAWADGRVDVYHEHFASERLRDFLAAKWRPLSKSATGPTILLTTLPGERHALGLHMAAVVVSLSGCKVAYLGGDTPLSDIEGAARQTKARAVLLSISVASDSAQVRSGISLLRQRLPDEISIVIGGAGAPDELPAVSHFERLTHLHAWARRLSIT